jgi:hypothetical protein
MRFEMILAETARIVGYRQSDSIRSKPLAKAASVVRFSIIGDGLADAFSSPRASPHKRRPRPGRENEGLHCYVGLETLENLGARLAGGSACRSRRRQHPDPCGGGAFVSDASAMK